MQCALFTVNCVVCLKAIPVNWVLQGYQPDDSRVLLVNQKLRHKVPKDLVPPSDSQSTCVRNALSQTYLFHVFQT